MKFPFLHKSAILVSTIVLVSSGASPAIAEENDSISSHMVQQIVDENTLSPATSVGHKWINADDDIAVHKIDEEPQLNQTFSEQSEIPITSGERLAQVIDREDGKQIVTISPGKSEQEFRFNFDGKFLEEKEGYILVRHQQFEEPYQIIAPAWAQDVSGNKVGTRYQIEGDTLVQHVNASVTGDSVVADPYIRDVHGWGKKIGQELVFTKDETSLAAMGASYCAGKVRGIGLVSWLAKGACAGAAAVAAHATNTGRCLTIRALGGKYSPNIVFPYATRC